VVLTNNGNSAKSASMINLEHKSHDPVLTHPLEQHLAISSLVRWELDPQG